MTEYSIFLSGDDDAGGTCLAIQLLQKRFAGARFEYPDPTNAYPATIDNEQCLIRITDRRGEVEVPNLIHRNIRASKGALCVYDITSRLSFDRIAQHHETLNRGIKMGPYPVVLVGNKCDLEERREVTYEEGERLAKSLKCPFFETSAKDLICVEEAFFQLVREIKTIHQTNEEAWDDFYHSQIRCCSIL
jgi:GTPase KRas